jgi:putative zinc ribbon protein
MATARRRIPAGNSIAEVAPTVAEELDLERSGGRTAAEIHAGSHEVVGWRCPKGPTTNGTPGWRIARAGTWAAPSAPVGCPFCAGRRASVTNDLNNHPRVAAQFDVEANGGLTAADVPSGSEKLYWWRCDAGPDHRWQASPADRTRTSGGRRGSGCPFCARKQASVTNSVARFPEVAAQFDVEANGCTPDQVVAGSDKLYWWRCDRGPDHKWRASPSNASASAAAAAPAQACSRR